MSSIPLPALQINSQQQQPNQMNQLANLMQLRNQMQNAPLQHQILQQEQQKGALGLQSGQLDLQQQQQAQKDQQGIADWYKNIDSSDPDSLDPIKVGKALQKSGVSGAGIMNVQGKLLEQKKSMAALDKDQLSNQQENANNTYNAINGIIGETDPTKRAQAITSLVQTAVKNGVIQPQHAQQILQNPGAITDDQLRQEQHGLGVSTALMKSAASSKEAETGARKLSEEMNPQSSLYAPSAASVAMGSAPGAAQIKAGEVRQAAAKAGAEESARMPGEMALAAQRQALSQGDPNAAAQLLVNGDATLSELKSRGATPEFIAKTLYGAHKLSGGTYNAQSADAQFSVAKSPANVAFFGSAKSLTDKGGTLDQLQKAGNALPSNQIPAFNSIADWEKAATGSGPMAHYAATALGVADDYSKVMGGGQGSDTSRLQALNIIKANASPEARTAAIQGIRGAVGSQQASRIGSNPVLGRMYGAPNTGAGNQQQNAPVEGTTKTNSHGDKIVFKGGQWQIQ
jgi:hypothetical protein